MIFFLLLTISSLSTVIIKAKGHGVRFTMFTQSSQQTFSTMFYLHPHRPHCGDFRGRQSHTPATGAGYHGIHSLWRPAGSAGFQEYFWFRNIQSQHWNLLSPEWTNAYMRLRFGRGSGVTNCICQRVRIFLDWHLK